MTEKHNYITEEWVEWIRRCYEEKTDFEMMMDILLKNFDPFSVDQWVNHIWFAHKVPENACYDMEFSWMPRDLNTVNGIQVEYLNLKPVVAILHNILGIDQCDQIIEEYRNDTRISRATVHNKDDEDNKCRSVSNARTNSLMHLGYLENPVVTQLEKNIAEVSGIPVINGEATQLLYYQTDQEYTPHDDFFHDHSPATRITECGQRIATVVTYLSDVKQGGGTHFPNLDITVPARAGTAVYFEYTDDCGASTTLCRHAGLPVIEGEKWALSKWLRMYSAMPKSTAEKYI